MSATTTTAGVDLGRVGMKQRFPFKWARVAAKLGLSKGEERGIRLRFLREGEDWVDAGDGIRYSEGGVERLGGIVERGSGKVEGGDPLTPALSHGEREGGGTGRPLSAVVRKDHPEARLVRALLTERAGEMPAFLVEVKRVGFPNGQVVGVRALNAPGLGDGVMRVRSSENFLPGMRAWARVEAGVGAWVFCGRGDHPATEAPVCPRSRGRW